MNTKCLINFRLISLSRVLVFCWMLNIWFPFSSLWIWWKKPESDRHPWPDYREWQSPPSLTGGGGVQAERVFLRGCFFMKVFSLWTNMIIGHGIKKSWKFYMGWEIMTYAMHCNGIISSWNKKVTKFLD